MRRSAAPSQAGGSAPKRPCFNPPFLNTAPKSGDEAPRPPSVRAGDRCNIFSVMQAPLSLAASSALASSALASSALACAVSDIKTTSSEVPPRRSAMDILSLIENRATSAAKEPSSESKNESADGSSRESPPLSTLGVESPSSPAPPALARNSLKSMGFTAPSSSSLGTDRNAGQSTGGGTEEEDEGGLPARYLSVMWAKLSKKKHKKWEGDAILVARGRTVKLVDMEGKEIARGSGYKTTELETLCDGQMLVIGGKEIEVMGVLSEEQYRSGSCFESGPPPPPLPIVEVSLSLPPPVAPPILRPFVKPTRDGGRDIPDSYRRVPAVIKPHHDPDAPNALVMPRPSDSHQWQHNVAHLPVVDVVVDPHVVRQLRPHQRDGVTFLYQCLLGMKACKGYGAILADEMGLGKTLQCIAVLWTLYKQGPYGGRPIVRRVLIITPGSLVKNWSKEFRKWLSPERLSVFAVCPEKKVEDFVDSPVYPVLIISYEMFVRSVELLRRVKFDLLICDEGHRLKNSAIKTTTLVNSLRISRRVVLTGTPLQNDLQELYSIADFTNPGILGTSGSFRHVYEDPILASRQPGATAEEARLGQSRAAELSRLTGMFILRRTQEINNQYLPPKVDLVLFCGLTDLQQRLYRQILSSRAIRSCLAVSGRVGGSVGGASGGAESMAPHLCCIDALKKLCNHPQLIYADSAAATAASAASTRSGGGAPAAGPALYGGLLPLYQNSDFFGCPTGAQHSGKMCVVDALLRSFAPAAPAERVVLMSNYTKTLDLLETLCKRRNYEFLRLDGQTPTSKRVELVDRFNNKHSNYFVFLLSTKAGGVGLNLIGASRLVLYDIDWNPANDIQAMARVWRDGQARRTFVYRLLSTGTLEEKMYQRQVSKQGLSAVVIDSKNGAGDSAASSSDSNFSTEQLRELFSFTEGTQCATHDLLHCYCRDGRRTTTGGGKGGSAEVTNGEGVASTNGVARSCQLGVGMKSDQKNMGMDELLEWKHVAGPNPDLSLVDPLSPTDITMNVTYAFWTESNSKPATVSIGNGASVLPSNHAGNHVSTGNSHGSSSDIKAGNNIGASDSITHNISPVRSSAVVSSPNAPSNNISPPTGSRSYHIGSINASPSGSTSHASGIDGATSPGGTQSGGCVVVASSSSGHIVRRAVNKSPSNSHATVGSGTNNTGGRDSGPGTSSVTSELTGTGTSGQTAGNRSSGTGSRVSDASGASNGVRHSPSGSESTNCAKHGC